MTILAYTDGASRGNPGESGIGIILKDELATSLHLSMVISERRQTISPNIRLLPLV